MSEEEKKIIEDEAKEWVFEYIGVIDACTQWEAAYQGYIAGRMAKKKAKKERCEIIKNGLRYL